MTSQQMKTLMASRASIKGLFILACTGALAACGGAASERNVVIPPPAVSMPAQLAPGTWIVMGSSTAAGAGAAAGKGWTVLLQAAYQERHATISNIAKGGTVSYDGLSANSARIDGRPTPDPTSNIDQALSRKPALLIVAYPTNDTARGYGVNETVRNLTEIRARALAAAVPVLMLSTQPRNLPSAQLNELRQIDGQLQALAAECFVPIRDALAGPDGKLAPNYDSGDGVHPNEAGHQLIATHIKNTIDSQKCVKIFSN